jgi:hypothetical protein
MIAATLIEKIKSIIISIYNYFILYVIKGEVGFFIVILLFIVNSRLVNYYNKFCSIFTRMSFISPNEKLTKTKNLFDDFVISIDGIDSYDEVNIVIRGSSFQCSDLDKSVPTFFHQISNVCNVDNPLYSAGDIGTFNKMKEDGKEPIIFFGSEEEATVESDRYSKVIVTSKINKNKNTIKQKVLSIQSALPVIIGLCIISKKVNVYGWDMYLDDSLKNMSYLQVLKYLASKGGTRVTGINYRRRVCSLFARFINLYYAYRLMELPNVFIRSRLSGIDRHKKLINKIENMIYRK